MDDVELVDLVFADGSTAAVCALVIDPARKVSTRRLTIDADKLVDQAAEMMRSLQGKLIELAPDEFELTVKIGVAIESGKAVAVFANGKVEGAVEVSMTWKAGCPSSGQTA